MNKTLKNSKPFCWRRYVLLMIALAIIGKTLWFFPRTSWSLKDSYQETLIPNSGGQTGFPPKDIRRIVLISIDTCRADHLGCYGYSRNTSPNIDALANEGIVFNHAVAPVPTTLPSHCSMLTGTIPEYHKVHDNIYYRLSDSNTTLAETLRENGFITGAIVGAFVLNKQFGLNQGFDTYDDRIEAQNRIFEPINERKAEQVTELANLWLEKHRREKFFLFLHYFDPHRPYEPHERFRFASLPCLSMRRDRYDGEIAYTDHYVGKVIGKLKQMGLYDSTLIILAGDHGESLDEHGETAHTFFIYHSTIHVPLIVKLPGLSKKVKVNDVAGLIDIMPTICGLLGIELPPHVQGQDLSAYFRQEQPSDRDRYLYCESRIPTKYNAESLQGVVTNQYKYINTTHPELYDLLKDKRETENIIKEQPQIAKKLNDRLIQILGQTVHQDFDGRMELDGQALKRLASLGYLGGTINEDFSSNQNREDPKDLIDFHESSSEVASLMLMEKYGKAKKLAKKLIAQRPGFHETYLTTLADILATHPDPKIRDSGTAIVIAEHGAELTEYQEPYNLIALAAAYAGADRFELAIETAKKALDLATAQNEKQMADQIKFRLTRYKKGRLCLETHK